MMVVLAVALGAPFLVITGFVFVFSVRRLLDTDAWRPWYIKAIAYAWLVVGGLRWASMLNAVDPGHV